MFKLGDFVRFVDEKREGYVTRIIDAQTLGVTDTDGFEIPVAISNLTHVHGHVSSAGGKQQLEIISEEDFKDAGVFLAVATDGKMDAVAHFSLINRSSYQLLVSLKTEQKGIYKGEFGSAVLPKTATQLYSANLANLDLWPTFNFQILFFSLGDQKPKEPLIITRRFKAKDFNSSKEQIPELNKYGWLIELDKAAPLIDPQQLKESFFRTTIEKPKISRPDAEVDLHIERLHNDYQFLNESEIINIQLNHFQQMLDAAIANKMPSIVFIHGVGNGTLRHHIHKTISKHPQVRTFMDARKEKFGFGATEVVFKT